MSSDAPNKPASAKKKSPGLGLKIAATGRTVSDSQLDSTGQAGGLVPPPRPIELPRSNKLNVKVEDLDVMEELGAGNGGTVHRVVYKPTGAILARKIISVQASVQQQKQIMRELKTLHDCDSPYIVSYYGCFLLDGDISIVMEYMDCGSLEHAVHQVGALPEKIVAQITFDVLRGLVYLYDTFRIVHRDVKPSNILLNSRGEVKIADFGVSGQLINSMANTFVGTSSYMSPERIQGAPYAVQSDVWSLGITMMEVALGQHPFPNMSILELLQFVVNEPAPTLPAGQFSPEFEDFLAKCLQKIPENRPTPAELLRHPWLAGIEDGNVSDWLAGHASTMLLGPSGS